MDEKEWTIMIYMAGDNNLAVDMAYAMQQIREVAGEGPENPNLFVYYDGNSPEIPTLYCDFSEPDKPKYVRSYKVPDKLYDVPRKPNENAADSKSVYNFVHWCLNQVEVEKDGEISYGRRAKKYAMIFSGHSLGFQDKGLFKDETSGKTMKMVELYYMLGRLTDNQEYLDRMVKKVGFEGKDKERESVVLIGQKINLLGFDSCVMGMLEVGYQFNDMAETMIASEGSVPNAGWTYAKILRSLTSKNADTKKVAELFVREFIKTQDSYTVGGVSVDMAAWDLSKLTELVVAFEDLAIALIECFADETSRIYKQMERIILQVHWKCQTYMYDQNIDLGDFCELLDKECEAAISELGLNTGSDFEILMWVREDCQRIQTELRKAVLLAGFSGGAYQYSNGISVFFPWSREGYEVSKKNYNALWFTKEADKKELTWAGFLQKYLYEVALRKFEPPTTTPEQTTLGSKFKYFSGVRFDDEIFTEDFETVIENEEDTKLAGQQDSKLAGPQGSKLAGQQGSKLAGQQGSKLAGQQGSKLAGQQGSKIAGNEESRLAGQQGSKLAGGSSETFFERLRLFKNIESRWNISGFTKKTEDSLPPTEVEVNSES